MTAASPRTTTVSWLVCVWFPPHSSITGWGVYCFRDYFAICTNQGTLNIKYLNIHKPRVAVQYFLYSVKMLSEWLRSNGWLWFVFLQFSHICWFTSFGENDLWILLEWILLVTVTRSMCPLSWYSVGEYWAYNGWTQMGPVTRWGGGSNFGEDPGGYRTWGFYNVVFNCV